MDWIMQETGKSTYCGSVREYSATDTTPDRVTTRVLDFGLPQVEGVGVCELQRQQVGRLFSYNRCILSKVSMFNFSWSRCACQCHFSWTDQSQLREREREAPIVTPTNSNSLKCNNMSRCKTEVNWRLCGAQSQMFFGIRVVQVWQVWRATLKSMWLRRLLLIRHSSTAAVEERWRTAETKVSRRVTVSLERWLNPEPRALTPCLRGISKKILYSHYCA